MKSPKFLMTLAVATFILSSCSKSGSSDSTSSSMQFQLGTSNPLVVVNKVAGPGTILWTSGSAYAAQVKMEAKQNASELEFKSVNPHQVDLFGSVVAGLGNITLPSGTYTEVEFKISLNQNGSSPAMELNGQYTRSEERRVGKECA